MPAGLAVFADKKNRTCSMHADVDVNADVNVHVDAYADVGVHIYVDVDVM